MATNVRNGAAVAWGLDAEPPRTASPRPRVAELSAEMGVKVAHELKNPISGMKALVQLGLRNPTESPSHARLAVIERELTRMQEIVTRFVSAARPLDELTLARVELGPIVSETLLLVSAQAADARVRLRAFGDATVEADRRRLEEALLNLVANALQATPPGGEVAVEVRPSVSHVDLVVSDTGSGLSPEVLQRLGTPFFTTRGDGTGLGVLLARAAFELHGGSLRYESEPGKGTTVTARLPRRARSAGPTPTAVPEHHS